MSAKQFNLEPPEIQDVPERKDITLRNVSTDCYIQLKMLATLWGITLGQAFDRILVEQFDRETHDPQLILDDLWRKFEVEVTDEALKKKAKSMRKKK